MTRSRVSWTLVALTGSLACTQDYLCTTEAHPSLLITARSARFGELLTGLSGAVTSKGHVLPIGCVVLSGGDHCEVFAGGESADIHLERTGFMPWDTTNVRLQWSDAGGCRYPILQRVEARMEPEAG